MLALNGERKFMSDLFGFGDRSCKCTLITQQHLFILQKKIHCTCAQVIRWAASNL